MQDVSLRLLQYFARIRMRTGVASRDSGCGFFTACYDQRNDPLNAIKLQESDNQPRYSELFKRIVFHVLNLLLVLEK